MKHIDNYAVYKMDGKDIVIVSDNYRGVPMLGFKFDILIGSKDTITRYKSDLIPPSSLRIGWNPTVKYI